MTSFTFFDYLQVSPSVREDIIRLARQFRKEPTPTEAALWERLRSRKLGGIRFRRQQPLGPFVVDFFAASHRLIVEVDGPIHDQRKEADAERQRLLESVGFRFVRVTTAAVEERLSEVLDVVRAALAGGTGPHPPGPPLPRASLRSAEERGGKPLHVAQRSAFVSKGVPCFSPPLPDVGEGAGG